ncbi:MAG: DUF262 domain-containing protein [Bacteroidales bacterium]|nr:DUF262 domain-containing protein [Bacteroidales bacterium]
MAKLSNLKEIFEGRIFRIPLYQRDYSWRRKQLDDLWEDLKTTIKRDDKNHFMGVITCSDMTNQEVAHFSSNFEITEGDEIKMNQETYKPFFIVDGQQRLTTLLILLSVFADKLKSNKNYARQVNDWKSFFLNNDELYKFDYYDDEDKSNFLHATFNNELNTLQDSDFVLLNLKNACEFFEEKTKDIEMELLKKYIDCIENRFLFYFFEIPQNEVDISLVFETMNNRGIPLSKLELLKNRLLYLIDQYLNGKDTLRKQVQMTWNEIYKWLGKKTNLNDDDFLRSFYIMFYKHDGETEDDFNNFEKGLFEKQFPSAKPIDYDHIQRFLTTIKKSSKLWYIVNSPSDYKKEFSQNDLSEELFNWLQMIILNKNCFSFVRPLIMAVLYRLLEEKSSGEEKSFVNILKAIERHNFITYLLAGKKKNANRADILREIYHYFTGEKNNKEIVDFINEKTTESINTVNIFNNIWKQVQQKPYYFYSWEGCKYFLWNWECELEKRMNKPAEEISIKYKDGTSCLIFSEDADYPEVCRQRDKESIEKLRYSLGNLTFSKIQRNKNYKDNKALYLASKSYSDRDVANKYEDWSDKNIYDRGCRMFDFLLERWDLKDSKIDNDDFKRKFLIENIKIN